MPAVRTTGANTVCGHEPWVTTASTGRAARICRSRLRARETVHGRLSRTLPKSRTEAPLAARSSHNRPRKHKPNSGSIAGAKCRNRAIVVKNVSIPPNRLPEYKCSTFNV